MTAASGAGQPTLRDQLADELAHWPIGTGYYATNVPNDDAREMADALLPLIEADRERAKAEGGAEALEQAADAGDTRGLDPVADYVADWLRARAAALRSSTGGGT